MLAPDVGAGFSRRGRTIVRLNASNIPVWNLPLSRHATG